MILKCKICGGDLEALPGITVGTCDSCGSRVTLPSLDDDKRANLYNRAGRLRRAHEYDKAASLYENILAEDMADAEAYWSLVLCKFGVEYVEDPHSHRMVPTCNRTRIASIFEDEDYRRALEHAEGEARFLYEEEAGRIDAIQRGILEISNRETVPFDIFICYKETDERGRRTEESVLAQDIYEELTSKGYGVFFSRVTLADKLGTAYEPYIFAALRSAAVMLVVGTRAERLDAVWVKNEWSRYLALIKAGARKTLIPVYRGIDPEDMPDALRRLQGQDMGQLGSMQDLVRIVGRIVGPAEPWGANEKVVTGENRSASLIIGPGRWRAGEAEPELRLDNEGRTVLGFAGEPGDTLIIPDGVTSVAAGAFMNSLSLERAIFPDGMTEIAPEVFKGCVNLKILSLPDDLETIGDGAFANCASLESLNLGESVSVIGEGAFMGCAALNDVMFPFYGLKSIGGRAFFGCAPKSLDLPRTLETIGAEAFADCAALEEIILPDTLCSVGERAFDGCFALKHVTLAGGRRGDKIPPFAAWGGGEFSAARPDIVISDDIKTVGENAFTACGYLVSLTIPRSVETIGRSAFAGCAALKWVKFEESGLQSICADAFAGCTALKGIDLPPSLKFIGKNAFAGCVLLRRLTFPGVLEKVEEGAFSGCSMLEKITVKTSRALNYAAMGLNDDDPRLSVKVESASVGEHAFAGWAAMKNLVLNKEITYICAGAFQNCSGLTELKLPNKLESVEARAFANCAAISGELKFPPSIEKIGESAFAGCAGLDSVTLQPSGNCTVGKNAFAGCTGLRRVNFDTDSSIDIEEGAFRGCSGIEELRVPGAADIGSGAFADCGSLRRVIVTGKYTSLGEGAFAGCDQLTEVVFDAYDDGDGEYYSQFDFDAVFAGTPYIVKSSSGVCPKCGERIRRGKQCKNCGFSVPPIGGHKSDAKPFKILLLWIVLTAAIIYATMSTFYNFAR